MSLDASFDVAKYVPNIDLGISQKQNALPQTIEKSPVLEIAEAHSTKIAYATAENLKASLPETDFKVRSADHLVREGMPNFERVRDSRNVVSTENDPAVIVIYGASFCSLMLAKDDRGNAVGIHQPITYEEGRFSSMKQAVTQMKEFFSTVTEVIKGNKGFLLLSGANPFNLDDDNQQHLEALVRKQLGKTNLELAKMFIKPSESEYLKTSPFINRLRDIKDFFVNNSPFKKSIIPKNIRTIDGLIYVPRQIDQEGTDRIFIMDRSTDNGGIQAALFGKTSKE